MQMVSPEELARLVVVGIAAARQGAAPQDQIHTARPKMKNPENFDGKTTTPFNQWWESVTMFLGFYPNTGDRQKIAWLGTLLTVTALVWHLQRFRDQGEQDTWVNYAAAIRTEYHNEREAAYAQLKLGPLKYQGSIRTYLTEFRALNNFARATGEGLREKIDMAIPDSILDMRFNQNPHNFLDDEPFLQATYRVGLQVEKKKALKQAKEAMRGTGGGPSPKDKEGPGRKNPDNTRGGKEKGKGPQPTEKTSDRPVKYGAPNYWATEEAALQAVPITELREHISTRGYHRCGRAGHRAAKCYADTTNKGTTLPQAPWEVSVGTKRGREPDEDEETPATKSQKISAADAMELEPPKFPLWESEEEDF